jgi:hypothetical protein
MAQQQGFLGVIGALWMGFVLVALILSAFFTGPRAFLETLGIASHLLLFWAAMLPGIGLALLAEKQMASGSGS